MKHCSESEVLLPRGWWTGDGWERRVRLRGVDDSLEESLLEQVEGMLPVERDTVLLSSCVLGAEGNPLAPSQIRELSIGDREALVLRLRRMILGNTMQCLLHCPACTQKMDLELKVDDLIVEADTDPQSQYEVVVEVENERLRVNFHLPTGDDVERAIRTAGDPEKAVAVLAQRCINAVTSERDDLNSPGRIEPKEWPATLLPEISARIEELDPQAEVKLHLVCPACGQHFEDVMDSGGYLLQELAARQRVKYQEVHQLAKAYHWSEADILRIGPRKRQLYLELLAADNG